MERHWREIFPSLFLLIRRKESNVSKFMGQVSGEGSHVGTEVMGAALQGVVLVNRGFLGGAGDGSWGLALPQQSPE